ncbi:hypothetical protein B5M42_021315 [Paenibacillus athensensis]|uniref:Uncharacterized protein n=1 Tax=Paenibacillus athensensis TaxID=1967502 RepID=A0A4Y8PZN9_9BACL|nr:hypothetical protein [Paenibacillus athensensis]MCD1261344.1 hypothetical protein [Paenibacillus athensensis]
MLESLQAATSEDASYFYSAAAEKEIERGCIGHLRGDFGRSGEEFWVNWFTRRSPLQTPAFEAELGKIIQALGDHGVLQSRMQMLSFCRQHPEARIRGGWNKDVYGFCLHTPEHRYYLRCFPHAGDYNFYLYSYAQPERLKGQPSPTPKKKQEPQR